MLNVIKNINKYILGPILNAQLLCCVSVLGYFNHSLSCFTFLVQCTLYYSWYAGAGGVLNIEKDG